MSVGPLKLKEAALVERDADTFFFPPNDMAWPLDLTAWHKKCEVVGDEERRHNFQCCADLRHVANDAIDATAAELDRPGLKYAVTQDCPMFLHGKVRPWNP